MSGTGDRIAQSHEGAADMVAIEMVAIEMERGKAAMLLGVLEQRLESIQKMEKTTRDRSTAAANAREKEAIIPAIMALAAALKAPRR